MGAVKTVEELLMQAYVREVYSLPTSSVHSNWGELARLGYISLSGELTVSGASYAFDLLTRHHLWLCSYMQDPVLPTLVQHDDLIVDMDKVLIEYGFSRGITIRVSYDRGWTIVVDLQDPQIGSQALKILASVVTIMENRFVKLDS